jgi:signal transduction histidine kinase
MNINEYYSGVVNDSGQPFGSYLHQLSHDLRTPLTHVQGFAELLLLDDSLSPAQSEYVHAILRGSELLNDAVLEHLEFMVAAMAACTEQAAPPVLRKSAA